MRPTLLLPVLAAALACRTPTNLEHPAPLVFERDLIGTRVRLQLCHDDPGLAAAAAEAAFARVLELDAVLSDYDPDSELRRLTAAGVGTHPVSADLHAVLLAADRLAEDTGGAFDVTVGPLSRLWRRARRRGELPDPQDLAAARARVGTEWVEVAQDAPRVRLGRPDLVLDLGGLAKGYVLDEVLEVLHEHGIEAALVDAGGDLVASAAPPGREAWRVVLADLPGLPGPDAEPAVLHLVHGAIASSGDAFQRLELDGVVHSHLVDPRTGRALQDRASATVSAPTAMLADGLASALCVLDPAAGLALVARTPDAEARTTRGEGAGLTVYRSADFPPTGVE